MPIVRLSIPVYLPMALYRPLRRLKRAITDRNRPTRNLWGDRDVEYSFIAAHMPNGPGKALDFGSGSSYMSLLAALRGFEVIALDLEPQTFPWRHPAVRFIQGDLLELDLPTNHFDLIINCSTVEHVGLVGRYSVTESRPDGDLEAMARLRELMKPSCYYAPHRSRRSRRCFRPFVPSLWKRALASSSLRICLRARDVLG